MSITPRISVLMGIYNCADTLEEALNCLLNQTYTDWKCIMCDDGSRDNTYEIANEYVNKYPEHFVLIKNETNQGLNKTLNNCLAIADTEYIARMDGDDLCDSTRFEKQINFLDAHQEYAIVSTPMKYFDENGIFRVGSGKGEPIIENFAKGTPFCHAPCMVRKEAFDAVKGYSVDDKLLRVEDWHLWIKMYSEGYKGYIIDAPLYMMRDDQNAISRRKFKYRINEARVSAFAIKELNLSKKNYIWCFRPIIVGLLPSFIYKFLHKRNAK